MNHVNERRWSEREALVLGLVALLGAACGSGSAPAGDTNPNPGGPRLSSYHADPGGQVLLRDRLGNAIPVGSTAFYSPEQTCGGCHDVAKITEGYHFQQGRGTSNANITVADNYNPAKPWLLSDGMYGKW